MRHCLLDYLLFLSPAVGAAFPPNANHIFNAIHSSMRQWGSSLHHNGMSFFLASVPAGTQFYHGSFSSDPVSGPEWLAFEPEHALVFANPLHHGRGRPPPPGGERPPRRPFESGQSVISAPPPPEQDRAQSGFLHTFAAARDLRLLYVDGMSAGKTRNGTLDSQDRILFRDGLDQGGRGMGEVERAEMFCRLAREAWEDRLDGVIRMEAGFEIILCDFARSVELLRVTRVRSRPDAPDDPQGQQRSTKRWLTGVASRYHSIGGHRVSLNYEHFVTAYDYSLDLFGAGDGGTGNNNNNNRDNSSSPPLPRLTHLSTVALEPMRQDLDSLIRNHDPPASDAATDWQAIADMVVHRYALSLRYLGSGQAATLQEVQDEVEDLMTPFIDYDRRNAAAEIDRCAWHYLRRGRSSSTGSATLAAETVLSISRSICATLHATLDQTEYQPAVGQIRELMDYLSWTTWKECNGCGDHETCLVPMWPMGTVDDYNRPRCRDNLQLIGGDGGPGYWGGRGGGGAMGNPPGRNSAGRP